MQRTEKWVIRTNPGDYASLGKSYGVSPVLLRILRNRGLDIENETEVREFLFPEPFSIDKALSSGRRMKDMDKAVRIIREKIGERRKIRIVGDYDIDGVTASFILQKGLKTAGAHADHKLPHRVRDGYGLNENIINDAAKDGIDTIITCDNGISAAPETALAKSLGMTVVVTDHHEIPFVIEEGVKKDVLPEADAVVDPKRSDCKSRYKSICGAFVAFKFILCLYDEMGIPLSKAEEFTEIAAFATIGDVMPLTGENRILVRSGLKKLENTVNPGLRSLISLNQLEGKTLTPYYVGFILGPCLNAPGRLGDAEDALLLLLSAEESEAHDRAVMLKEMNESRKSITERGVEEAMEMASSEEYESDRVLVIFLEDSHESVAGIVAGKVRERTGRPSFILTKGLTSDGEPCFKGSGRSTEAYNMFEEMTAVKDVFIKYGGHAMAAGLSLPIDRLDEFRRRINENCRLREEDLAVRVYIDMELPLSFAKPDLIEGLKKLEPCGTGNEKPLFAARDVMISDMKIFGANNNVLKGTASDLRGGVADCIYFGSDAPEMKEYIEKKTLAGERLKIVFNPEINEFRGSRTAQIVIGGIK